MKEYFRKISAEGLGDVSRWEMVWERMRRWRMGSLGLSFGSGGDDVKLRDSSEQVRGLAMVREYRDGMVRGVSTGRGVLGGSQLVRAPNRANVRQ